jgi:predicted secreted protein
MPNYILGKEMTILYNGLTVGAGTSYGLNINKSMVDVTSLASAGWKDQYPDIKDWSVDFDGLVSKTVGDASVGFDYLVTSIKADASISIALKPNASTNKYESGVGYITKLSLKGGKDGVVVFSGSITGTGALTTMTTT